jgi:TonB family protein
MSSAVSALGQGVFSSFDHSITAKDVCVEKGQGGHLSDPAVLPLPIYPPEMLRVLVGGEAVIKFCVNGDGSVSDVTIVSCTDKLFGMSSRDAVARWTFGPNLKTKRLWASCRLIFKIEDQ